jgi:hypothetical protein
MRSRQRFVPTLLTLLLFGCLGRSLAQTPESNVSYPPGRPSQNNPAQMNTDPPARVARVQYMTGEVSIQPGGVNDWVAASLNRPLTTSDRVWTDKDSKAELNLGGGYIRLNSETSVTLTNVSDNTVQVELHQGVAELTVNYLVPGLIYEVDTPNLAFTAMKPGVYRFNVYPDEDQTWVTVRKGQGEATGRGNAVKIKAGEQVRFSSGTSLAHTSEPAPAPDGFDDWASVRDQRLESSQSARYVAPGVIGYQDLDTYGSWQTVAPYGAIWVPYSVPVGWAPYRFGHWVWIAPWGWTWVDNAPWGFAPFHYGRWVNTGGHWGWAPGPYRWWRPCYAPALVGWIGGPGWGAGFGFAGAGWGFGLNFGWFPLGWGEPFYPWYHGWHGHGLSSAYVRNVNVTNTNVTNITNITRNYYGNTFNNTHYANRNIAGAVTAAPQTAISNGQPIDRYGATVNRSQLMHAPMLHGIQAAPTREAVLGGESPNRYAAPPSAAFNRTVVTRTAPPAWSHADARAFAPSAGSSGSANPGYAGVPPSTIYNVPRPPRAGTENNDAAVRSTYNGAAQTVAHPPTQGGYAAGPTYTPATPYGSSNAVHPASAPRSVPYVPPSPAVHPVAPSTVSPLPSAPTVHAPAAAPSGNKPQGSNGATTTRPMAYGVPRPPAGYTYHAAPAYGAGGEAYAHSNSFVAGSSYSPASSYNAHGSYGASSSSGPVYTPAPSNNVQHTVPYVPHEPASSGSGMHYAVGGGAAGSNGSGAGTSHATHGSGGGHTR